MHADNAEPRPTDDPTDGGRVLFLYWGRRGSLSWLTAGIAGDVAERGDAVSFSSDNELADRIAAASGAAGWPFPTFSSGRGAITGLPRFFRQRRALRRRLAEGGFTAVVVLMSHVWTPLLGRALRSDRIRYAVVVHDAAAHPGDGTARANRWLLRDAHSADLVIALTDAVAEALAANEGIRAARIAVVPHPAIAYGAAPRERGPGPLRVLFLGRIMAYKGLLLLVSAMEDLRQRGIPATLSVYGEGNIAALRPRLAALGATVVNRWIDHGEIGAILAGHDLLVLPYVEASQSGVAAAAQGAGMPVIATPVGGLGEQVRHGVDGLIAAAVTAAAVADAIAEIATDRALFDRLRAGALESGGYDVAAFAARLRELVLAAPVQNRRTDRS